MQFDEHVEEGELATTPGARARRMASRLSIQKADWADDGIVTLLLHHGDAIAADPAFKDIQTGAVRPAGKKDSEALAHAAHFLIACSARRRTRLRQWRALLEKAPNISRSAAIIFFSRICGRSLAGSSRRRD